MSRKYDLNIYGNPAGYLGGYGGNNCTCSLPTLTILILILLQFNNRRRGCGEGHGGGSRRNQVVDNGILFIIALFYLACMNPCSKGSFTGGGCGGFGGFGGFGGYGLGTRGFC